MTRPLVNPSRSGETAQNPIQLDDNEDDREVNGEDDREVIDEDGREVIDLTVDEDVPVPERQPTSFEAPRAPSRSRGPHNCSPNALSSREVPSRSALLNQGSSSHRETANIRSRATPRAPGLQHPLTLSGRSNSRESAVPAPLSRQTSITARNTPKSSNSLPQISLNETTRETTDRTRRSPEQDVTRPSYNARSNSGREASLPSKGLSASRPQAANASQSPLEATSASRRPGLDATSTTHVRSVDGPRQSFSTSRNASDLVGRNDPLSNSTTPSPIPPLAPIPELLPDRLPSEEDHSNAESPPAAQTFDAGIEMNLPVLDSTKVPAQSNSTFSGGELAYADVLAIVQESLDRLHSHHGDALRLLLRWERKSFARKPSTEAGTTSSLHESPLRSMSPVRFPTRRFQKQAENIDVICVNYLDGKKSIESLSLPVTRCRSTADRLPYFSEYATLQSNHLIENENKLIFHPYPGENREKDINLEGLGKHYDLEADERESTLDRRLQCRVFKTSVENTMTKLGISWENIIFWLLAEVDLIDNINQGPGFPYLKDREAYSQEMKKDDTAWKKERLFNREDDKWKDLISRLQPPTLSKLRTTAAFCLAFSRVFSKLVSKVFVLSIWHVARYSDVARREVFAPPRPGQRTEPASDADFTYRKWACRICFQHDCISHGEIRDDPQPPSRETWSSSNSAASTSDSETSYQDSQATTHLSDQSSSEIVPPYDSHGRGKDKQKKRKQRAFDIYEEYTINYRLPVPVVPHPHSPHSEEASSVRLPKLSEKEWEEPMHEIMKRGVFYPCNHPGTCDEAQCRCFRAGVMCEKICGCARACRRRYRGCTCAKGKGKGKVCREYQCTCRQLSRECDADLCGKCGADEILDPVNRYKAEIEVGRCSNAFVTRSVPKRTFIGKSTVHGLGLFMGENVKKDEFIGQYVGEILGKEEAKRRDYIYGHQKTSYTFNLTGDNAVDSTYAGNKIRFINDVNGGKPNLVPRTVICNNDVRIGFFAAENIKIGDELFFDYMYPEHKTADFVKPLGRGGTTKSQIGRSQAKPATDNKVSARKSGVQRPELSRAPTPDRRRQTEAARQARAAKRAAKPAQEPVMAQSTRKSRAILAKTVGLSAEEEYEAIAETSQQYDDDTGFRGAGSSKSSNKSRTLGFVLQDSANDPSYVESEGESDNDDAVPGSSFFDIPETESEEEAEAHDDDDDDDDDVEKQPRQMNASRPRYRIGATIEQRRKKGGTTPGDYTFVSRASRKHAYTQAMGKRKRAVEDEDY
ncbi:hypothetical protein BDV96DRAFT_219670 [Lophiotrema nucula]|uniref:SET domain-containing protein n=1 Tax=Lophiotrema nucula TaxID=690887 RepID=A0A6A5YU26_9PLEO|nr:hypothetical protein BDV96DRAFT_219670 [Lophiotrema nucula]